MHISIAEQDVTSSKLPLKLKECSNAASRHAHAFSFFSHIAGSKVNNNQKLNVRMVKHIGTWPLRAYHL